MVVGYLSPNGPFPHLLVCEHNSKTAATAKKTPVPICLHEVVVAECMYVCMVFMYVFMYVCMYVCMYV